MEEQTVDLISLEYKDNDRAHNDLFLTLGERIWKCDSYYLAIDSKVRPREEDESKTRHVLGLLISQWCAAVEGLQEGETCFLPFGFFDQETGWLRCTARGAMLEIQPGWSDIEGYYIYPSDVGERTKDVPDFTPDGAMELMLRERFLSCLRVETERGNSV